jgi:hypothetical protein
MERGSGDWHDEGSGDVHLMSAWRKLGSVAMRGQILIGNLARDG